MLTYSMDDRGSLPLYEYLYRRIRTDILNGTLSPGEKLPSKRALAEHLHVSVITVESAYAQLEAEGYIVSVSGKGTFVAEQQGQNHLRRAEVEEKLYPLREELRSLGMTAAEWAALWEGGNN